jgi:HlyD family type I secretion membrane fusion protein
MELTGTRTRLGLVRDEEASVAALVAKGYARRPRLLAIRRTEAELVANEGDLLATVARNRDAQEEVKLQIANLDTDRLEKIGDRLAKLNADRLDAEKRYRESLDRVKRTRVTAPVDGVVLDVKFKTVGGVVQPGQPILDIAPIGDKLVIECRIRTTDIDDVSPGASAMVVFPAFPQRYLKRVPARVVRVSADSFKDTNGRDSYYAARIEIDRDDLAATLPGLRPEAGMPAEVYIATTSRTLFDFLAEPVRRLFARAMRES